MTIEKFCSSSGASILQVKYQRQKKHGSRRIPKGIVALRAFWRRTLKQIRYQSLHIVITLQIYKRIVTVALFHIDQVKYPHLISRFFQQPADISQISPFGSSITKEVLHCIAFGLQKKRVFPAPLPPHTIVFRLRLCFLPSKPIRTFCVSSLLAVGFLSRYFLSICPAFPHLADPCSSPLR